MSLVEITGLSSHGEGIGTLNGMKIFTDNALPSEQVTVRIAQKKKNYAKGYTTQLVRASPDRVLPPCRYFGKCGGCQLMHLDYQAQLNFKRQRVEDALRRIGGLQIEIAPCQPSPHPLHYRNKIQLSVQSNGQQLQMGLLASQSHELINIDQCMIHNPLGERLLTQLSPLLKKAPSTLQQVTLRTAVQQQKALLILTTEGSCNTLHSFGRSLMNCDPALHGVLHFNTKYSPQWHCLAGNDAMIEELAGLTLRLSAASFFQVNLKQAERLYHHVIELAQLAPNDQVADLYCGVGALSLLAAKQGAQVVGIEIVPQAIDNARYNARLNGVSCRFLLGSCEQMIKKTSSIDVAFLNPPRQGCEMDVLNALGAKGVNRLVYISCDPATLARDLNRLCTLGYHVDSVTPFDMFPQTAHVEIVCGLTKNA